VISVIAPKIAIVQALHVAVVAARRIGLNAILACAIWARC
jgi:hypothetical protein